MFCGAGGSSRGAVMAKAEIVGGIDISPLALGVFSDNFPDARPFQGRVEDVDPADIAGEIGPVDLLMASPECTHHSCARGNRPRNDESRDGAFQVIRYAAALKPRWIIVENVVHMRSWPRYGQFLAGLRDIGYRLEEHVLDAADHGVAQRRRRLFLLCDRDGSPPTQLSPPSRPARSARSILDRHDTWPRSPLRTPRRATATLERAERAFRALGGEGEAFLIVYYGTDGAGGWQSLSRPLRTITTIDRFGLCEPSAEGPTLRMLQVPELARAMGMGEAHVLHRGTRREKIKLLGNGVCPPVMLAAIGALAGPDCP